MPCEPQAAPGAIVRLLLLAALAAAVSLGATLFAEPAAAPAAEPAAAAPAPGSYKPVWYDPDGNPLPFTTDEEVLEFLRRARPGRMRTITKGITLPEKVMLERDGLRMHAVLRDVRIERLQMPLADGSLELNFRDDHIFEAAAYELSRMLDLNTVPPTIVRSIHGRRGTLQAWIENAMSDKERRERDISVPDVEHNNRQFARMQIFDLLVYNTDRNQGNILYGPDWRLWMIDHTRAFRIRRELRNPHLIHHCDRDLYRRLHALDPDEVRKRLRPYLRRTEVEALLVRRDLVIELIDGLIAERGAERVLYDMD
jgi:hypothetical protein